MLDIVSLLYPYDLSKDVTQTKAKSWKGFVTKCLYRTLGIILLVHV